MTLCSSSIRSVQAELDKDDYSAEQRILIMVLMKELVCLMSKKDSEHKKHNSDMAVLKTITTCGILYGMRKGIFHIIRDMYL